MAFQLNTCFPQTSPLYLPNIGFAVRGGVVLVANQAGFFQVCPRFIMHFRIKVREPVQLTNVDFLMGNNKAILQRVDLQWFKVTCLVNTVNPV